MFILPFNTMIIEYNLIKTKYLKIFQKWKIRKKNIVELIWFAW